MASKPQPTSELYGGNIGPDKLPGDRYLRDIADETLLGYNPETFADKKATNPKLGADVGNVGPDKLPGDLYLSEKLDPMSDVILGQAARDRPRGEVGPPNQAKTGSIAILAQRRSIESYLSLGGGLLDQDDSPIGFMYHETTVEQFRRNTGKTPQPFENTQTTFETIQDAGLTAQQMERYQAIVERGDLTDEGAFGSPFSFLKILGVNPPGGSNVGISYSQAVEIVVGNSREGVSQFDPTTNLEWDVQDLAKAQELQNEYLRYQGLPALYVAGQIPGVKPNEFLFQRIPFEEAKLQRQGTGGERQQIRGDYLNYHLTMEEALQVAELASGQSRLYQNPREEQDNPSFDETLLYGDYVL